MKSANWPILSLSGTSGNISNTKFWVNCCEKCIDFGKSRRNFDLSNLLLDVNTVAIVVNMTGASQAIRVSCAWKTRNLQSLFGICRRYYKWTNQWLHKIAKKRVCTHFFLLRLFLSWSELRFQLTFLCHFACSRVCCLTNENCVCRTRFGFVKNGSQLFYYAVGNWEPT